MAGFFYIRVLLLVGVVSAITAALLGLSGPLLKTRPADSAVIARANAIERLRAGQSTVAEEGLSLSAVPELGPDYVQITAVGNGLTLRSGYLTQHETPRPAKD